MNRIISAAVATLSFLSVTSCSPQTASINGHLEEASQKTVLLRSARVFDPRIDDFRGPWDILIKNDRIQTVGSDLKPSHGTCVIDCSGKYALPGLFDCHTHLAHLAANDDVERRAKLADFVRRGVMQVRDVGGPIDVLADLKRRIKSGEIVGPELFYTGPLLEGSPLTHGHMNETLPGITVAVDSVEDVDRILPELARNGACMIKTFGHIDKAVYRHIVEVAPQYSLRIVHDPGMPLFHAIPMDEALELGVTSIEHAKAPWPVVLTETLQEEHDTLLAPETSPMTQMMFMSRTAKLGVDSVSLERLRRLADRMFEKNAYLCPTLVVLDSMEAMAIAQTKKQLNLEELPPPILTGLRQNTAGMEAVSRLFVSEFAQRGVRMLVGQDGVDPAGVFAEMRWMHKCGVSNVEVLKGATIYPAQWLGVDDRLGSIDPGKQANLLIVNGNPLEDLAKMEDVFMAIQHGQPVGTQ